MKNAFTLIELLVVVLIIGILSAIALPQYTKAVEKSRAAEAMVNINMIKQQMDLYMLANTPTAGIDFKDVTSVDLSGGEWDGNYYKTKYFSYRPRFNSTGGWIEVIRRMNGNQQYVFYITKTPWGDAENVGGWYHTCFTNWTKEGTYICKAYESMGYYYYDEDPY